MSMTLDIRPSCLCAERLTAAAKRWRFLKRIRQFDQMDFQFALWQMVNLVIAPRKVYRNFVTRKQSKDQFARDDPAFLVLLGGFLCLSSALMTVVLGLDFVGFIKFLLWSVFADCIGAGIITATGMWLVSNALFRADRQHDVEWGYSFDIHLNASFAFLVFIHIVQPVLYYPLLNLQGFIGSFSACTLYLVACSYYLYITFLGYSSVSFLKGTRKLLYIFPFLLLLYIVTVGLGWNVSHTVMTFFRYRGSS